MKIKFTKAMCFYGLSNLIMLMALFFWVFEQNQSVNIVVPKLIENKVQCVSYAPFYKKGDSPLMEGITVSQAQIEHDLQLLAKISHCVRTYSVGQGMDYVPQVAEKLGLSVYLGAWIGWTDVDNIKEINLAAEKANAYPNTVKGLIIGNEVFLRGEQDEDAMQAYFLLAKRLTQVPITYADVWEFWVKHKNIAQYIDFHTVHILPYWENDPVAIADSITHAENVMRKMRQYFTKPILIGETGWPSMGRQRSESVPSIVNQAKYLREFINKANENNWQYNIIEAIDQPWKRSLEGTVGGYWGIITSDLIPKFSMTGPVAERDDGYRLGLVGLVGAVLFLTIAVLYHEQRIFALLGLSAFGSLAFMLNYFAIEYVVAASRDWIEWFALGGLLIVGILMIFVHPYRILQHCQWLDKLMYIVKVIFLYSALIASYLIYFDGRYRDFPILLFALPIFIMVLDKSRPQATGINFIFLALPAALGAMFAVLCFEKELTNHAALGWMGLSLALAYTNWPTQSFRKQNNNN